MHKSRRVKITDINPHLTCVLCSGYLIDATTIIECLHSFCRTCIVKYLENNKYCPICDVQVHKTKPLLNIRSDQTLQDIVYKLVPGLFQNEMCRRRDLYSKHPDQKPPSAEDCGEVTQYSHIYTADESISLSLEYYNNNVSYENDNNASENKTQAHASRRFLRCPAAVTVSHLQKLIRAKYGLSSEHRVDILYLDDRLSDDFTLMDIAYIYLWRRKGPLHLTYRIFEVAKKIKQNDEIIDKHEIKSEPTKEEEVQNEWKEVQLQISENGVMSITNISESKPETVTTNIEVKTDILPELSPIQKQEKPETKPEEIKLGKHKLDDSTDETSAKVMKPNLAVVPFKPPPVPVKNVQQLSQNHPLKMHSQITKNHVATPVTNAKIVTQNTQPTKPINNNNNNNGVSVQKDHVTPTVQIQNNSVQNIPNLNFKIPITTQSCTTIVTMTTTVVSSSITNLSLPNSPKYTQATTITTPKPEENKKVAPINNCIQSSKVSIVPRKTPIKTGAYKTLRDPPKAWNPQIPRQNLNKPTLYPSNNGASTSDLNKTEKPALTKPAKFFKMRNVPRYLGNPASGVKPLYVREGDKSPEAKKPEIKKPETKLNNNNELKIVKSEPIEVKPKPKIEIKKHSIIKIDPKTLRPISQEVPSCSDTPEMKINQSTVPIFTPLRTQKSQTSPKIDRRSPKTTYMDIQPPKSPMGRASPKSTPKPLNSPTSKKDKVSLNFTPANPFIPNLTSPNLAPNQFLYPNFPSYDPRVMNAYHPYSMLYAQSRLNYPGLASQNLPLSPNLMSSLNLEVNKNLRKSYEMSMMQLSPTMDVNKKTSTSVKNFDDKDKKNNLNKTVTKVETKQLTNSNNKDEKKLLQPETKPKTELENNNEKSTVETEKKVESKKENVQENNKGKETEKSTAKPAEKAKQSTEKPNETKS